MPIKPSAIKALKQSKVKRERNVRRKKLLKDTIKKSTEEKDIPKVQSVIDRIAKSGLIHKNKASRLKSKIAKKLSSAK